MQIRHAWVRLPLAPLKKKEGFRAIGNPAFLICVTSSLTCRGCRRPDVTYWRCLIVQNETRQHCRRFRSVHPDVMLFCGRDTRVPHDYTTAMQASAHHGTSIPNTCPTICRSDNTRSSITFGSSSIRYRPFIQRGVQTYLFVIGTDDPRCSWRTSFLTYD